MCSGFLDILDASQFDELHLETGDFKLSLRRSRPQTAGARLENQPPWLLILPQRACQSRYCQGSC